MKTSEYEAELRGRERETKRRWQGSKGERKGEGREGKAGKYVEECTREWRKERKENDEGIERKGI